MNKIDTLMEEDALILKYLRRAKALRFSVMVIKIQDGKAVHIDITEQVKL